MGKKKGKTADDDWEAVDGWEAEAEAIAHEAAVEAAPVREPSVWLDADADGDDALANLWLTIAGAVPHSSDASGDDDDKAQQGYDKSPRQRKADCSKVSMLLKSDFSANIRDRSGASLLYHALQYDHRHMAEMLRVVVEAGADVNMPTHIVGGLLPLDTEWLEVDEDNPHVEVNRAKREYLISHGARQSDSEAEGCARAEAQAKAARIRAEEVALEQRLADARHAPAKAEVPSWDTPDDAELTSLHLAVSVPPAAPAAFVTLTYNGRSETVEFSSLGDLSVLFDETARLFELPPSRYSTKLILKGKSLRRTESALELFGGPTGAAPPRVMVMASAREAVATIGSSMPDLHTPSFAAEHGSKKGGIPTSKGVRQASMKKR